ncbi:hypothetical protein BC567DRAFT_263658 [Phyllosticta citribraziliensis]
MAKHPTPSIALHHGCVAASMALHSVIGEVQDILKPAKQREVRWIYRVSHIALAASLIGATWWIPLNNS